MATHTFIVSIEDASSAIAAELEARLKGVCDEFGAILTSPDPACMTRKEMGRAEALDQQLRGFEKRAKKVFGEQDGIKITNDLKAGKSVTERLQTVSEPRIYLDLLNFELRIALLQGRSFTPVPNVEHEGEEHDDRTLGEGLEDPHEEEGSDPDEPGQA